MGVNTEKGISRVGIGGMTGLWGGCETACPGLLVRRQCGSSCEAGHGGFPTPSLEVPSPRGGHCSYTSRGQVESTGASSFDSYLPECLGPKGNQRDIFLHHLSTHTSLWETQRHTRAAGTVSTSSHQSSVHLASIPPTSPTVPLFFLNKFFF